MDVVRDYDSDEEEQFHPCERDWKSTHPLLRDSKPLREDYAVVECIGQGSYSRVYKVRNLHTGEMQCAKNFFPQCVSAEVSPVEYRDISDHAVTEISTLQSLHHRSILPIYGVYRGRRRGSVYMVTELYETTLEELLSLKYPLSLEATKCILYELLDVLESVHAQGLLHSDLKPGNVLYRGGGIAVCDWGRRA
ncbi:hypothetical protein WA577_004606 [Blastocystis sp. JDR]